MKSLILSVGLGLLLAIIGAKYVFVNSGLILIPWRLAGLAIGAGLSSRKEAAACGAGYGFTLAYAFMLASYNGAPSILTRLVPFLIFGLVGAVCGAGLYLAGYGIKRVANPKAS